MLDFARAHAITATSEVMPMGSVNDALERVKKNEVRYRAVLTRA
jgi:D-arabinose 1-dehydrogenase-like Zn-dependent alcohol dehydrogenase